MTENIVRLVPKGNIEGTTAEIAPAVILEYAKSENLIKVVVLGYRPDGTLYVATSTSSGPEVNWMLDQAKADILEIACE